MGKHDGWGFADGSFRRSDHEQSEKDKEDILHGLRSLARLGKHASHVLRQIEKNGYYEGSVIVAITSYGQHTDWRTPDLGRRMLVKTDGKLRGDIPDPSEISLRFQDTKRKSEMEMRIEGPVITITGPSKHEVRMKPDIFLGYIRFNKTGTVVDINTTIKVRKKKIPVGEEKTAFIKKLVYMLVESEARVTTDSPYTQFLRKTYVRLIEESGTFERLWKFIMEMEPILSVEKS